MTRDEAIKLMLKHMPDLTKPGSTVDFYAEAGILKLDAPKSAWEKFATIMVDEFGYSKDEDCPSMTLNIIKRALDKTGLKIVEK